ncbi:MAG: hypothetical protein QHH30_10680, partial [candidate division NC10 bacterium]|nr:hypothetical protein [candidate division NC10 bacterium]
LLLKPPGPAQPVVPPAPSFDPSAPAGPMFTGLVVDSRGLHIRPAMAPKILDEEGREVYGAAHVKREYAIQKGMAGYSPDLAAAQAHPRVANHPLTVKGVRAAGSTCSDIVISNADAAIIRSEAANLSFLEKCRVMIVVD